jgi:hypothetical protein
MVMMMMRMYSRYVGMTQYNEFALRIKIVVIGHGQKARCQNRNTTYRQKETTPNSNTLFQVTAIVVVRPIHYFLRFMMQTKYSASVCLLWFLSTKATTTTTNKNVDGKK